MISAIISAGRREGVPPPIYIEETLCLIPEKLRISRSNASTYLSCVPHSAGKLRKSQYPHFFAQNGMWIYNSMPALVLIKLQNIEEGVLRDFNVSDLTHLLLSFLLFLQELLLAGDISAIAFCKYILAESLYGLSRDHL